MSSNKFLGFVDSLTEGIEDKAIINAVRSGFMAIHSEVPTQIFQECANTMYLFEDMLLENGELIPSEPLETDEPSENEVSENNSPYDTIGDIDNDFDIFMSSLSKSNHPEMLEFYSKDEYKSKNAKLYKLKDIDAGFVVAGDGDIISVHNNSNVKGLGGKLIAMAKSEGGTKLDHFDMPILNKIYSNAGFKEYHRMEWNDQYAPKGWNYERNGRPNIVERKL